MNQPSAEQREGFQVYALKLMLPKDMAALDPATRRELMICDLFLTEKLTISEIVRVPDGEDQKSVIITLIKRRVLQDRRGQQRVWTIDRRRMGRWRSPMTYFSPTFKIPCLSEVSCSSSMSRT
jgi:hypothetical protein